MVDADTFDNGFSLFKEQQAAPWNNLRYNISMAKLKRHMGSSGLMILDAGGGNGVEAIALAQQGNRVTLLDYSAEMLTEARNQAANKEVGEQMEFHQGDILSIPQLFPQPLFDLVLCHNVLQYVPDTQIALQAVCHAVKPGGLLSVIAINRYSQAYRLALHDLDMQTAYSALDEKVAVSQVFDAPMQMYSAEDLRILLQGIGCSIEGEYGLRCVNDYIANDEPKHDPAFYEELEKLELAMSDRFPYYLIARFFQLVARKHLQ
jgi:S-adenosylmethionine-dependent methyltransferase